MFIPDCVIDLVIDYTEQIRIGLAEVDSVFSGFTLDQIDDQFARLIETGYEENYAICYVISSVADHLYWTPRDLRAHCIDFYMKFLCQLIRIHFDLWNTPYFTSRPYCFAKSHRSNYACQFHGLVLEKMKKG